MSKAGFFIEAGWASLSKFGEELCGDNVEVVRTDRALVAVLADGLGSGVKANILSKMTAKIIATMLENGAELEEVVDTVSKTLPVCQKRNLAYSTFTIMQIAKDGEAYIVEFDNPSVFFLREGGLVPLKSKTTEICARKIKESRLLVAPGDVLVAVSDGVIHAGIGGVLNLGWQWPEVADYLQKLVKLEDEARDVSNSLLNACEQLYAGKPGDDTTVLTLKVRPLRRVTVAVGPPQKKEDDATIVRLIQEEPGRKVVCGGTTGTIVAKALGEEIEVDLAQINPEVPPAGRLKGIDLVTEGIITLSKTLELLRVVEAQGEALPLSKQENAATALARVLLDSDQVLFLVGRAINPAHQNPELPMNLALKMQVVGEIADLLRRRGKQVEVEYF
jgi:hypothetical protein